MTDSSFFVTASGTELGKTLVTAALTWQLRDQKRQAFKPVISGFDAAHLDISDVGILLAAQDLPVTLESANHISPWRFSAPVSPHLAAQEEGSSLSEKEILMFCEAAVAQDGITLIEGAGGAFSPLIEGYTQADLLKQLDIPAIVVVGSYVGAISHSLSTIEALLARGIVITAVVISESSASPTTLEQTHDALKTHLRQPLPLFTVPRISPKTNRPIWQELPPLTGILSHD